MKILCHNSRSLLSKIVEMRKLISNIDYMCISESWLLPGQPDHLAHFKDMTIFRQDRENVAEETGGGVACYVAKKYSAYTRRVSELCKCTEHIEVVVIITESPTSRHRAVVTVYKPPRGVVSEFVKELTTIVEHPLLKGKEIWIAGDTNVDFKKRNSNKCKKLLAFLKKQKLKHLRTGPTRLHPLGSTIIDQIYTNAAFKCRSGNVNEYLSDHIPIYAIHKKDRNDNKKAKVIGRSYKNYNKDNLVDHVNELATSDNTDSLNANEMCSLLSGGITAYLDKACPIKELTITEADAAGFDDVVRVEVKERQSALRSAVGHTGVNINHHLKKAKKLRQSIQRRMRQNVAKDIKGKLNLYRKNPKRFWEKINELWKGKKTSCKISLLDEQDGHLIEHDDTASYINNYFCTIGSSLAEKLKHLPGDCDRDSAVRDAESDTIEDPENEESKLVFSNISVESMKYLVDDIEEGKSSGIDNTRSKVIKDTMVGNMSIWTSLMNKCISESNFPCNWKSGTIIPLPKSGNLRQVVNWRPITLLPIIGKLLEKILYRQIMDYIQENEIISSCQFGFLPDKSTALAILNLTNNLYSARNRGEFALVVYLDITKAFDVVHHGRLLKKLRVHGFSLSALKAISSYLEQRKCCTLANDTKSSTRIITYGVPQGSVLGPLLVLVIYK